MKSKGWTIAAIIALVILALYAYVEPKIKQPGVPTSEISDKNPKYNLHPETDKTDTFAIQLDSSEEDQNVELQELENGYKRKK
jgi:hypothetical protein